MESLMISLEMCLRLLLASFAGMLLGWEREATDKPAGLRTHMMVSLGSALFVVSGILMAESIPDPQQQVRYDVLRVLAGIVGGVGFLGAGAIIQSQGSVKGLTTAASIWLTAALGAACGMGYYLIAFAATGLGLLILIIFRSLERNLRPFESRQTDSR